MARISFIFALYRETEMIEQLLLQITRLRHPKTQLDVLLMIEDDDLEIWLARPGYQTEMLFSTTYEKASNQIWP